VRPKCGIEGKKMPFSSYKSIGIVAKEYQIKYVRENFVVDIEFSISEFFRQELNLIFNEGVFDNSESAIGIQFDY
jgi:hypothetical protein